MSFFKDLKKQFGLFKVKYYGGHPLFMPNLTLGVERIDDVLQFYAGVAPVFAIDVKDINSIGIDSKRKAVLVNFNYHGIACDVILKPASGLNLQLTYSKLASFLG